MLRADLRCIGLAVENGCSWSTAEKSENSFVFLDKTRFYDRLLADPLSIPRKKRANHL